MRYNNFIASLAVAIGALASLGAIIYMTAVQGHDADPQLTGLAGLLFGAFLRMPGQADAVQIKQPADQPVPVDNVGDAGLTAVELCFVVIAACVVLLTLKALGAF